MGKETRKEFFDSVLGLGPDSQVSEVTLNETSHLSGSRFALWFIRMCLLPRRY
jgi:hypothetical protein